MLDLLTQFAALIDGLPWPVALLIGVVALIKGGEWLVRGAVSIARTLGVSTLLIGLTIVAFGTSAPELALNVNAALAGSTGLSFGNVIGSNIANIALVLGAAAVIAPIDVHRHAVWREIPKLIVISIGLLILGLAWPPIGIPDPTVAGATINAPGFGRADGVILLFVFVIVMLDWANRARQDANGSPASELVHEAEAATPDPAPLAILFLVLGLIGLFLGGQLTERGAVAAAAAFGVSDTVIGLTVVAIATSLPELAACVAAARAGHADIAVGNIVGSNLFNILLVLGVTSTVAPIPTPAWGDWDLAIMLVLTIALLPLAATTGQRIRRIEGGVLLVLYAAYLTFSVARELIF